MSNSEQPNRTFKDLTEDEIRGILSDAIDSGDWHSPSVKDLQILEQNPKCVYGKFKSSLHNTYWDEERGFNINADSVQVWEVDMVVGTTGVLREKHRFKPIHNIQKLAKKLAELETNPIT